MPALEEEKHRQEAEEAPTHGRRRHCNLSFVSHYRIRRLPLRTRVQNSPSHTLLAAMGNALGKKKTLKEQLRENKREINRAIRELDRERTNLQMQEKKLIIEIKKMAKEGQIASVKIMAKDLVRTRQHVTKFYTMRSQLQAVSLRLEVRFFMWICEYCCPSSCSSARAYGARTYRRPSRRRR